MLADFEGDTYGDGLDGDRRRSPARGRPPATIGDQQAVSGYEGRQLVEHVHRPRQRHRAHHLARVHDHHATTSTSSSAAATTPTRAPRPTADVGQPRRRRRTSCARRPASDDEALNWTNWNVAELDGQDGADRHRRREHRRLGPHPRRPVHVRRRARQFPRSTETAVNLLVDGEVVRTTDRPEQRDARLGALERPRPRSARPPRSRSSTATPAAGATSSPTSSRSPTQPAQSAAAAQQLARLRQGLLRRGHLERRARRPPDRDRLDEQLALRQRDPDAPVAQRDERPARARPAHHRRPHRSSSSSPSASCARCAAGGRPTTQRNRTITAGHDHAPRARQGARDRRRPAPRPAPSAPA